MNDMNENKTNINWYPGHMTKAKRKIQASLNLVDAVAETVDARIPKSSRNPDLDEMLARKPRIILLNKCDMANGAMTDSWINYYKSMGVTAIAVDCKSGNGLKSFIAQVRSLLNEKIEKAKARGILNKSLRIMVVGIPNVGKSSFINRMSKEKKAKVEDRPGVTRGNQWFSIGQNVELLDTPGVLWPKFEDPEVGEKLAFCGAVKDQVVDIEGLASRLLRFLCENGYTGNLINRYKLNADTLSGNASGHDILKEIGKKRGMLLSKNEIDVERAAITVLDEFREAKLGKFTLDFPER